MTETIKTLEGLKDIQKKTLARHAGFRMRLMICGGTGCHATGSIAVRQTLQKEIETRNLSREVELIETGCNGFCAAGPILVVQPEQYFYQKLTADDVPELVETQIIRGKPVERLMYKDPQTGRCILRQDEIPFFGNQTLLALRNRGMIDPEKIEDYIARDGYQGAAKALLEMAPDEIISEMKTSGLRGRGGAGFPTGLKWEFARSSKGDVKFVLCNADEGDPGAFMDRSILEADPHAVVEGMIIAGKAISARQGYVYARMEYPLAIKRLTLAIEQARSKGLLGQNILGSGFDFELDIYQGAGAFVCGEETALMRSIEGKRGTPRPRPPFPALKGLWDKPTILNNVETFANVPQIIIHGGAWYAGYGTESAKGTKVFAVTGKINNIGLVEVPMGTPIGRIIYDIGGGIPAAKPFKAAQLGGPSGGCIPASHLNLPTDYEEISKAGAIMGSGGMIVMDEDTCMVDMARYFMDFCQDESCGNCTPCRVGTQRMLEILQNICKGKGKPEDIGLLESLSKSIMDTSLCGLGQTAPNPVLSTLRYFMDEYKAHIYEKRCPAGVCSDLFSSPCKNACPVEMDIPGYIALIRAGRLDDAYRLLKQTNPFPSVCGRVCGHPCQNKCRRSQLDEPLAIKNLKRFVTDHASPMKTEIIPVTRSEKIAIVGAGPAGLTAALEMKKRGYAVTVFEAMSEAGGMLRWGIPAYRLPRSILDKEIKDILDTGVVLRTNFKIGQDIGFNDLEALFDAIYIGIGAQKSASLGLEGETAQGVIGAVEFLRNGNLGLPFSVGHRVAVIGGGNSAIDAARTALRMGAKTVTILYRRQRNDMPALPEEIHAAEEEGVQIQFLAAPKQIITKDGRIKALKIERMKLDTFDASGRKRPKPILGSEFEMEVDTLIPAIGQEAELGFINTPGFAKGTHTIRVDAGFRTSNPKVWAGGDVVTGPAMVIDAIAAGRKAAASMDKALREAKGEKPWEEIKESIDIPFEVDEDTHEQPQARIRELAPDFRRTSFAEVELGYDPETAILESRRCVRCDAKGLTNP